MERAVKDEELYSLKNSLEEPLKCSACGMEILPYANEKNVIVKSTDFFCDKVCKDIFKTHFNLFLRSRKAIEPKIRRQSRARVHIDSGYEPPLLEL